MISARVSGLFVYPVKSCKGVAPAAVDVLATGFRAGGVRDREWMIVDRRGRFVTQREYPRLALVRTHVADGAVALALPGQAPLCPVAGGEPREVVVWHARVRGFDAGDEVADALSAYLGTPARLVRFDDAAPRRCNPDYVGDSGATTLFSDGYPVLVIGQASLDDLNARLAAHGSPPMPMDRFRPGIVIEGLEPYDEDHLESIRIGGVTLKPVKPCTRCEITTTDQASAHRGIEPLRTLATYRRDDRLAGVTFGMNAIVTGGAGGGIALGDTASVELAF